MLDTSAGRAAAGLRVVLWRLDGGETRITEGRTNADGRFDRPLLEGAAFAFGTYRLDFHVGEYFRANGVKLADPPFLDVVPVRFAVAEPEGDYHVPLLVTPWSYSTYRGS